MTDSIAKPEEFDLSEFRSKRDEPGVGSLLSALPHSKMAAVKDYVRIHPEHWTEPLCFTSVRNKGQYDTTYLITDELAERYLPASHVKRLRLALATDCLGRKFLCHVPHQSFAMGG